MGHTGNKINKIKEIVYKPGVLLVLWLGFISSPLLSVLRYNYLNTLTPEQFSNRFGLGLAQRVYSISFFVSLVFTFVVWIKNFSKRRTTPHHFLALIFIVISSLGFEVLIRILLNTEFAHYSNYLYSTYGIKTQDLELISLANFTILAATIALFSLIARRIETGLKIKRKRADSLFLSLDLAKVFLVIFAAVIMFSAAINPFSNLSIYLSISRETYISKIGERYIYVEKLMELVPESGKVVHPPQGGNWPEIGNQPVIRYFLFPRTLISGVLMNNQETAKSLGEVYFVQLPRKNSAPEWPTIDFARKTISFNTKDELKYKEIFQVSKGDSIGVYKIIFK